MIRVGSRLSIVGVSSGRLAAWQRDTGMVENVLGDRRPFFLTSALHVAPKSVFGVRLGTRRVRGPRKKNKKRVYLYRGMCLQRLPKGRVCFDRGKPTIVAFLSERFFLNLGA